MISALLSERRKGGTILSFLLLLSFFFYYAATALTRRISPSASRGDNSRGLSGRREAEAAAEGYPASAKESVCGRPTPQTCFNAVCSAISLVLSCSCEDGWRRLAIGGRLAALLFPAICTHLHLSLLFLLFPVVSFSFSFAFFFFCNRCDPWTIWQWRSISLVPHGAWSALFITELSCVKVRLCTNHASSASLTRGCLRYPQIEVFPATTCLPAPPQPAIGRVVCEIERVVTILR